LFVHSSTILKTQNNFKIVLYAPDIPGNTGSIGRTCVALQIPLVLIHPLGFELSGKAVRRAGLDYWKYVEVTQYENFDRFFKKEKPDIEQLFFLSKTAEKNYFQTTYPDGSFLIFGSETKGLPKTILKEYGDRLFSLPMYSDKIRSLNLSNAATAVAYEVLRQNSFN